MSTVPFSIISAGVLCLSLSTATLGLAEITGSAQDARAMQKAIQKQEAAIASEAMWTRAQQRKLTQSLQNSEYFPFSQDAISLQEASEKCFPWTWEGGNRNRVAVASGAELCLKANLQAGSDLSKMNSRIEAISDTQLFLLATQFDLARAHANATMPLQGAPAVAASVSVLGKQIWTGKAEAPTLNWSKSSKLLSIEKSKSVVVMIGPVPATVTIGARGSVSASFTANLNMNNGNVRAVPVAEMDGFAFGGIDLKQAKGAIEGNLHILQSTTDLHGSIGIALNPATTPATLVYAATASGHNSTEALQGKLELTAETTFDIPGYGKSFRYPLYSHPGYRASGYMFLHRIDPTPIKF
jgi:hypothetical protein